MTGKTTRGKLILYRAIRCMALTIWAFNPFSPLMADDMWVGSVQDDTWRYTYSYNNTKDEGYATIDGLVNQGSPLEDLQVPATATLVIQWIDKPVTFSSGRLSLGLGPEFGKGLKCRNLYVPGSVLWRGQVKDAEIEDTVYVTGSSSDFMSIGQGVFSGSTMKHVDFQCNVRTVWNRYDGGSFSDCPNLLSFSLKDGCRLELGQNSFLRCPKLSMTAIPGGVTTVGNFAFAGCPALVDVKLPSSVTNLGEHSFENCASLKRVDFGPGLRTIGYEAFCNCSNLLEIVIPDSVTTIGLRAFDNCAGVTNISLGAGWNPLGNRLPGQAENLGALTLSGNGERVLGNFAFVGLKMRRLVLKGVAKIDNRAWTEGGTELGVCHGCPNLEEVVFLDNAMTSIGEYAFADCTALKRVHLPNSLTNICDYAFNNCSALNDLDLGQGVRRIGYAAFANCGVKSLVIPDSVNVVSRTAFHGCTSLTNIWIGAGWNPVCGGRFPEDAENLDTVTVCGHGDTELLECAFTNLKMRRLVLEGVSCIGDAYRASYLVEGVWYGTFGVFEDCTNLREVVFRDDVLTSIGSSAFKECSSLVNIRIPKSVQQVGTSAFYGCSSLAEIRFPENVRQIGSSAFAECTSLVQYDIDEPGEDLTIGQSAFRACSSLATITVPQRVTSLGSDAFKQCVGVKSITLVDSGSGLPGKSSGGYNLSYPADALNLDTLTIRGNGNTFVPAPMFNCFPMRHLVLSGVKGVGGGSWTTGGNSAFSHCSNLVSVVVEDSALESIGAAAFHDDVALTAFDFPDSVRTIGDEAFANCVSIKDIVLPASVETVGQRTFTNCLSLASVAVSAGGQTLTMGSSFAGCTALANVSLPEFQADIRMTNETFAGCSALRSFRLTDAVTFAGPGTLRGCTALTNVWIGAGMDRINNLGLVDAVALDTVTIRGNGHTEIGYSAFEDWGKAVQLRHLSIAGVAKIEVDAFRNCTNLADVVFCDSALISVGSDAFRNCSRLPECKLPSSVMQIDSGAFSFCAALGEMAVPEGVKDLDGIFESCPSLAKVTFGSSVTNLSMAFKDCVALKDVPALPGTVIDARSAFAGCVSLESAVLCDGIKEVSESMFDGCVALRAVSLPSSVERIGTYAFRNCSSLQSIELPEGLTNIAHSAFLYCASLQSIAIPDGPKKIDFETFQYCTGLKEIVIPGSVESIDGRAFSGCTSLEVVHASLENEEIVYYALMYAGLDVSKIVITTLPVASDETTYVDALGVTHKTSATTVLSSDSRAVWQSCWYVVTNEVSLAAGAHCQGDVNLILADGAKLTATGGENGAGISVDGSLTIYGQRNGTGELVAFGDVRCAGIGGGAGAAGTNITINGGVVMAFGGYNAAGIGGSGGYAGSNITINGGVVMATGGEDGAGIGGGTGAAGTDITINGGVVTATGDYGSAGIGGGYYAPGANIFINGGTVTATGGVNGSGIGAGEASPTAASGIFAVVGMTVRAGASENPADVIPHTSGTTDIADALAYKRYVTIGSEVVWETMESDYGDGLDVCGIDGVVSGDLVIPASIDGQKVVSVSFSGSDNLTEVTSITVPDSVEVLGSYAFAWFEGLVHVTLGSGVRQIEEGAFEGDDFLQSIDVSSENVTFSSEDGCVFSKDGSVLYRCPGGKTTLTLRANFTEIASGAFDCNWPPVITRVEAGAEQIDLIRTALKEAYLDDIEGITFVVLEDVEQKVVVTVGGVEYDITDAFDGGELDPKGSVTITVGGQVVTIPVTPVIGDLPEDKQAFSVDAEGVSVSVRTIPGLRYALKRELTLGAKERCEISVADGDGTVKTFRDSDPPDGQAFYRIEVKSEL